ncbi:ABC transporter ATP-binding protein [Paenibacillus yonginensis]|uniref:Carnitine transport ATP-binding protein OpuCA n=1 Tax=Paenibacillus yonginensis TaxID=1462996 RepID=A0A1B1N4W4_9BACL|nr:ABC transporter ATP-binding protein [Paenibacillus yonginensis]ANS76435.1 ABC transporter ATP-binding protein [Paenibacillus yonginensis]
MDLYIRGLGKTFGSTTALHPTDLTVKQGKFTTLLGPSGCGKTTLLRMIAGLETPDQGTISFGDEVLFAGPGQKETPPHKRGVGMVFQDFALWPHMTVFENVAFGLRTSRRTQELRETVMEALEKVKLGGMEHRYPHQLSGGQQQRVAFARAAAVQPRLVLFDEPLSALDAVLREEMRVEMISLVRDMGLTALYVTHDQIEAMSMSDEVVVMQGGRILQSGTPEEVYGQPADPFVARFIGKSNWLNLGSEDRAGSAQGSVEASAGSAAMFRPEHLRLEPVQGESYEGFEVEVLHVSYMGDRYELHIRAAGQQQVWTAYHHSRVGEGSRLTVYLPEGRIIPFAVPAGIGE